MPDGRGVPSRPPAAGSPPVRSTTRFLSSGIMRVTMKWLVGSNSLPKPFSPYKRAMVRYLPATRLFGPGTIERPASHMVDLLGGSHALLKWYRAILHGLYRGDLEHSGDELYPARILPTDAAECAGSGMARAGTGAPRGRPGGRHSLPAGGGGARIRRVTGRVGPGGLHRSPRPQGKKSSRRMRNLLPRCAIRAAKGSQSGVCRRQRRARLRPHRAVAGP